MSLQEALQIRRPIGDDAACILEQVTSMDTLFPFAMHGDTIVSVDAGGFSETDVVSHFNTFVASRCKLVEFASRFTGILRCGTKVLGYTSHGHCYCYDLSLSAEIRVSQTLLKGSQKIRTACSSRDDDAMFFFALSSAVECLIFGVLITGTTSKTSNMFKVPAVAPGRSVQSMRCHPTLPLLFVVIDSGEVLVLGYSNVRRNLMFSDESAIRSSRGQADDSNNDDGKSSVSDFEGNGIEGPAVLNRPPSVKGLGLPFFKKQPTAGKVPELVLRATLSPVSDKKSKVSSTDPSVATASKVAVQLALHPGGRLAAVVWSQNRNNGSGSASGFTGAGFGSRELSVSVYDIKSPFLNTSAYAATTLYPIGESKTFGQHIRVYSICFHAIEPVLLVGVASSQGSTMSSLPNTRTLPLVIALSLLEPKLRILGAQPLATVAQEILDWATLSEVRFGHCGSSGQIAIVSRKCNPLTDTGRNTSQYEVSIVTLCDEFRYRFGCTIGVPLISQLCTPPDIFLRNIAPPSEPRNAGPNSGTPNAGLEKASTAEQNIKRSEKLSLPLSAVAVRCSDRISHSGMMPLQCSYAVFRLDDAHTYSSTSPNYLGDIPGVASQGGSKLTVRTPERRGSASKGPYSSSDEVLQSIGVNQGEHQNQKILLPQTVDCDTSRWIELPASESIKVDGPFVPSRVNLRDFCGSHNCSNSTRSNASNGISSSSDVDILVAGVVLSPLTRASEAAHGSQLESDGCAQSLLAFPPSHLLVPSPTVCYIQYKESKSVNTHTSNSTVSAQGQKIAAADKRGNSQESSSNPSHGIAKHFRVKFLSWIDAAFWSALHGHNHNTRFKSIDSRSTTAEGILAICTGEDGRNTSLKWFSLGESDHDGDGKLLQQWKLPVPAVRLWPAPAGAENVVMFATQEWREGGDGACSHRQQQQRLILSYPNDPSLSFVDRESGGVCEDSHSHRALALRRGEFVIDIVWQPLPMSESESSAVAAGLSSTIWLPGSRGSTLAADRSIVPYIGVLTSHRVLILALIDGTLRTVSEYSQPTYSFGEKRFNGRPVASFNDFHGTDISGLGSFKVANGSKKNAVTSICWLGSALLYTRASGTVEYLLPNSPTSLASQMFRSLAPPNVTEAQRAAQKLTKLDWQLKLCLKALGLSPMHSSCDGLARSSGILCSLPSNFTSSGSLKIVACLPDRLFLAYTEAPEAESDSGPQSAADINAADINNSDGYQMVFASRPCIPAEPLILGLVSMDPSQFGSASSSVHNAGKETNSSDVVHLSASDWLVQHKERIKAVELIGTAYFPPGDLQSGSISTGMGALPTSQCTRLLVASLLALSLQSQYHLSVSALAEYNENALITKCAALTSVVSGCPVRSSDGRSQGNFSRGRWIASASKFHCVARLSSAGANELSSAQACLELLNDRPDLQDVLIDPESNYSNDFPHPRSRLAYQLRAASKVLESYRFNEGASLISGIAGCFAGQELAKKGNLCVKRITERREVIANAVKAIASGEEELEASKDVVDKVAQCALKLHQKNTEAKNFGTNGARRTVSKLNLPVMPHDASTALEAAQRSHISRRGGLGPLTIQVSAAGAPGGPPVLAMDVIDELMGARSRSEVIVASSKYAFGAMSSFGVSQYTQPINSSGRAVVNSTTDGGSSEEQLADGTRPSTWIDGVGQGRDWERVIGYWRFSDVIKSNETGFINSGFPGARANLVDLSRYSGCLEVYFSDQCSTSICLEPSSSTIDPGEEHEKVKSLCDVVYTNLKQNMTKEKNTEMKPCAGIRATVYRGGPLDVGLYHIDSNRCRLTAELSVCFDPSVTTVLGERQHVLLSRIFGAPKQNISDQDINRDVDTDIETMWRLVVESDGSLCFIMGRSSLKKWVKTTPGQVVLDFPQGAPSATTPRELMKSNSVDTSGGDSVEVPDSIGVWTHIAVVVDTLAGVESSGNSTYSNHASVTIYVNCEEKAKGFVEIPPASEQDLAITTMFIGPNLSAGWRLTELRLWADSRSSGDLENLKDSYLPLAAKRKRLQMRMKPSGPSSSSSGQKLLFGPLSSHALELGPAATRIVSHAENGTDGAAANTRNTSASTATASTFDVGNAEAVTQQVSLSAPTGPSLSRSRGPVGLTPPGGVGIGLRPPPPSAPRTAAAGSGSAVGSGSSSSFILRPPSGNLHSRRESAATKSISITIPVLGSVSDLTIDNTGGNCADITLSEQPASAAEASSSGVPTADIDRSMDFHMDAFPCVSAFYPSGNTETFVVDSPVITADTGKEDTLSESASVPSAVDVDISSMNISSGRSSPPTSRPMSGTLAGTTSLSADEDSVPYSDNPMSVRRNTNKAGGIKALLAPSALAATTTASKTSSLLSAPPPPPSRARTMRSTLSKPMPPVTAQDPEIREAGALASARQQYCVDIRRKEVVDFRPRSQNRRAMLWPRQEVLALTITQLSNVGGKVLSNSLVLAVVKQLSRVQSPEGKITYDRWLVVAKDVLKWNDSCIQLFWEMLIMALWYTDENSQNAVYDIPVDSSTLAVFLALHATDMTTRPSSPAAAYNTVWPANADMDPMVVSSQSPLSPLKGSGSTNSSGLSVRVPPSVGSPASGSSTMMQSVDVRSPKSPRSPKSMSMATISSMSPPSRSAMSLHSPRHGKNASVGQSIHLLKQKLPLFLRSIAVATEDEATLPAGLFAFSTDSHESHGHAHPTLQSTSSSAGIEFMLSRRAIDSLGLIFGGGNTREEQASAISSLHPLWSAESQSSFAVPYSELVEWIDSNLCVNELFYPSATNMGVFVSQSQPMNSYRRSVGLSPAAGLVVDELSLSLGDNRDIGQGHGGSHVSHVYPNTNANASTSTPHSPVNIGCTMSGNGTSVSAVNGGPTQVFTSMSSLSRSQPVVLSGCSSTYMHVVTAAPARDRLRKATTIGVRRGLDGLGLNAEGEMATKNSAETISEESEQQGQHGRGIDEAMEGLKRPGNGDGIVEDSAMEDEENGMEKEGEKEKDTAPRLQSGAGNSRGSLSKSPVEDVIGAVQGRSRFALPQVLLTGCHKAPLYFLGSYSSAFISGCNDCDIVIGAVAGIVVVSGCERVRLSVSCRKLIVHNSLECEFSSATLSPAVISGDSRSLVFGPLNVSYRHLLLHLRMADLGTLAAASPMNTSSSPSTSPPAPRDAASTQQNAEAANSNCWSFMCDVTACMESQTTSSGAASPSGYAIDAADRLQFSLAHHLPSPPQSTAAIMNPQKFKFVSIPLRTENQPPEVYRSALANRGATIADINRKLQALAPSTGSTATAGRNKASGHDVADRVAGDLNDRFVLANAPSHPRRSVQSLRGDVDEHEHGHGDPDNNNNRDDVSPSRFINAKFTEWLISTGKVHHLIDLVRLDAERASGGRLAPKPDHLEAVSVSTSNISTARST